MPSSVRRENARARTVKQPAQPGIGWRPIVVVLVGVLAYANSLNGPFILDDQNSIVGNAAIRHVARVGDVLHQHDTPIAGRPIAALSFAIDYAAGGLDVLPYHVTNIAIHILCAVLVFGIARRTLQLAMNASNRTSAQLGDDLAFAIAVLWVVHPLNSEAVDYLTQRTESLMALFLLLMLYAAIRGAGLAHAREWQAVAVASCAAGIGCKESMVVAPAIVILYDRVFLFKSFAESLTARWRLYAMLAATWLVLAYLTMTGPRSGSAGLARGDVLSYILNQARMIVRYLRLAVWPGDLVVNYGPVVDSIQLRDVLPHAIVLVALLIVCTVALIRRPSLGFLGAWIVITLAPTSSVIPIVTEVGAERRMYVPLIAIVALVVIGVHTLELSRRVSRITAIIVLAVVTLALGVTTARRNREYSNGLSLAESTLGRWPTDVAHGMVGAELMALHRDDEALPHLRVAARTDPRSRYNLGAELINARRFDEAARELTGLADEYPMREEALWARRLAGRAYVHQRDWARAAAELALALAMAPSDAETRRSLVDAENGQGVALVESGNPAQAIGRFRQAAALDPKHVGVRQNLASALLDSGDPAAAEREARQAIAIGPDAQSYDLLGRALALQGKTDDAVAQLHRALELSPHDARIEDDLRRVLGLHGK